MTPSVRHHGTSQALRLTVGVVVTRTVNREYCLHLTAFLYLRADYILHTLQLVKRKLEKRKPIGWPVGNSPIKDHTITFLYGCSLSVVRFYMEVAHACKQIFY